MKGEYIEIFFIQHFSCQRKRYLDVLFVQAVAVKEYVIYILFNSMKARMLILINCS